MAVGIMFSNTDVTNEKEVSMADVLRSFGVRGFFVFFAVRSPEHEGMNS
jgi:hypothetical protein